MYNKIRLYFITCRRDDITYEEQVEQACLGGADAVLFRDRSLSAKAVLSTGALLKNICRTHKVLFLIDGRPDIAFALNADGVHLEADDLPLEPARQVLGPRKIVSVSAATLSQAVAQGSADYILVGPIYRSETMPAEDSGVDLVRLVKKRVKVPVIAFGGITMKNVEEVVISGADGVAAARAVCEASSISAAARELKEKIAKASALRDGTDKNI